jgi:hypothetical protein
MGGFVKNQLSRRWFLKGSGGAVLAIPSLPSLLGAGEAAAQAMPKDKIFVGFMGAYGGCLAENFFPSMATPDMTQQYADRTIRSKALSGTLTGTERRISEVIRANANQLTPRLVSKMNLIQGIDLPFDVNHHMAATFGNFAQGDAETANVDSPTGIVGRAVEGHPRSSVDQIIANSSAFYPNLSSVVQRSVFISSFGKLSYFYPGGGEGKTIDSGEIPPSMSVQQLWDRLFQNFTPGPATRRPIVDLVLEDYQRVRSNPRLSKLDKDRLDQHVTRISEIQRRLNVVTTPCVKPNRPTANLTVVANDGINHGAFYEAFREIVVAALQCGLTRVVSYLFQGWDTTFGNISFDPFHQLVSHKVDEPAAQADMCISRQRMFSNVIVPLASSLDAVLDSDGTSLLDRSLLYFVQEHGTYSHGQENIPVVTFGSAAGAIRTGLHVDYRDLNRVLDQHFGAIPQGKPYVGLTLHQMLGSMLQWMNIPKAHWGGPMNGAESNHGGYGYRPPNIVPRQSNWRDAQEWRVSGEKLPFISV